MKKENTGGICKIAVKGFKSIRDKCEIDIRPLTILAGANSSGKSSIMQPLLMMKQTLEAPYDPGPLLIDGANVQFTLAEQFLSTLVDKKSNSSFYIKIETGDTDTPSFSVKTIFRKGKDGIEIEKVGIHRINKGDSSEYCITLQPDMTSKEVRQLFFQQPIFDELVNSVDIIERSRCFLILESKDRTKRLDLNSQLAFNIANIIHLPGLRGNPERTYKLTSTGPLFPGRFENYTASLIHEWEKTQNKQLKRLSSSLFKLKLTGAVSTKKIGDARIELQVDRIPRLKNHNPEMVSIADVGFGVSQVLPVLVALITAKPGQLVYIEQPELHLHPNAQVALAQVLGDAAKRGVHVVAETHSSMLLLGVQNLVAEGKLSPDIVKLHWFSRNKEGITKVSSRNLDKTGAYGKWPVDFDKVSLREQSRYIKASQSLLMDQT